MADIGGSVYSGLVSFKKRQIIMSFVLFFIVELAFSLLLQQNIPVDLLGLTALISELSVVSLFSIFVSLFVILAYTAKPKTQVIQLLKDSAVTYPRFLVSSILASLMILGGMVLLVIPGIYFGIKLLFWPQESVLDNKGGVDALKASWAFSENRFWQFFAFALLILVIALAISMAVSLLSLLLTYISYIAYLIAQSIVSAFLAVFLISALTEFFLQTKKEQRRRA